MNFCMQCGNHLVASPMPSGWQPSDEPTAFFSGSPSTARDRNVETQTFDRNLLPNVPPAKSNKTLFLALGGIAALGLLLFAVVAAVIGYSYLSNRRKAIVNNPTPTPIRLINRSGSPLPSPDTPPIDSVPPQVSFTPPVEPTKKGTFTVYANGRWQLSEIDTVPLEQFRTVVQGLVDLNGIKTGVSSKGLTDAKTKSRRLYAEHPTGALLMRTRYADGKYSNIQPVTASPSVGLWQNFPDERGRLEFCVNDNAPEQNGGQFVVTATMTSVPKAKK